MKLSPSSASYRVVPVPCLERIGHPQWTNNWICTLVSERSSIELLPRQKTHSRLKSLTVHLRTPRHDSNRTLRIMTIQEGQGNPVAVFSAYFFPFFFSLFFWPRRQQAGREASKQASKTGSKEGRKQASRQASKQAMKQSSNEAMKQ